MSEEEKINPVPPAPVEEEDDEVDPKLEANAPNLAKILSGRFILTVVGAISFFYFCSTICDLLIAKQQEIKASEIISILSTLLVVVSNIFTFYFVRKSMNGNGQG